MNDWSKLLPFSSFSALPLLLLGIALALVACDGAGSKDPGSEPAEVIAPETPSEIFRAELSDALRDPDPFARAQRLGALLPTMGPDSVSAVVDAIHDGMFDLRATELDLLVRAWARYQPEAAASWAFSRSNPLYRAGTLYAAINAWSAMDPQAAAAATWDWSTQAKGMERVVPGAIVRGWYRHGDSPELQEFVRSRPEGMLRQRALAAYVRAVAQTDGADAIKRWAESLDDEDRAYKVGAFRMIASELTLADLEAGLAWCDKYCDTEYGKNMRSRVARTWAREDGAAALEWLSRFPAGYQRDFDVRLTYARWIRMDPKAALAWLPTQEGESLPDWLQPALPPYARAVALSSPAKAITWAEKIKDERTREPILVYVARIWRQTDEAAAEAWLEQSGLSDDALAEVRVGPGVPNPVPQDPEDVE